MKTLRDTDLGEAGEEVFAEINVTPFVDVMLVLLVVFMVAAPLMVRGVPLELPRGVGHALGKAATPLIVSLSRDGSLYLRDERLGLADLEGRLDALKTQAADTVVYLRADRGVPYGDVVDVIGRLSAAGFTHVSLLSRPDPGAAK